MNLRWAMVATAIAVSAIAGLGNIDSAQGAVWEHTATWNADWQNRFSNWVASDAVHLEMALQTTRERDYLGVEMDCADFIYYLHAVFSFENKLDFSVQTRNGTRLSNSSSEFNSILDPNTRFKRFLETVLKQTNTTTLQHDSILLPISLNEIRAGAFLMTDRVKNHVWLLKSVKPSGTPVMLSATVPPSKFIYPAFTFPTAESAFTNVLKLGFLTPERGGFRRLRWPSKNFSSPMASASASASASTEQTSLPLANYFENIAKLLRRSAETPSASDDLNQLLDEVCLQLRVRTNVVTDAMTALAAARAHARPLSAAQIDRLSTEARDGRIYDLLKRSRALASSKRTELNANVLDKFQRFFVVDPSLTFEFDDAESYCLIQWAENRIEPVAAIISRFERPARVSARATDSLEARWGEDRDDQ